MSSKADVSRRTTTVSESMLRPGFELANADDMKIPRCVNDAEEAVAIVREHHERWLMAGVAPR